MTKIGEIHPKGVASMKIYYDEKAKNNPYKVYGEWYEIGNYGLTKHRKKITEYANLSSCVECMMNYTRSHDEEGR